MEDYGAHGCRPGVEDPADPHLAVRAGLPRRHALGFGADGRLGCQSAGEPAEERVVCFTWSRHTASRATSAAARSWWRSDRRSYFRRAEAPAWPASGGGDRAVESGCCALEVAAGVGSLVAGPQAAQRTFRRVRSYQALALASKAAPQASQVPL